MNKKWIVITLGAVLLAALLAWLFIESTKPLPGEKVTYNCDSAIDFSKIDAATAGDKCRLHIPEGSSVNYSTNPPTFGPHYPSWVTKGFYDEPRLDGNLVHSQEHGYIIIWYDCGRRVTGYPSTELRAGRLQRIVGTAYAQSLNMTAGSQGSASAKLQDMPEAFRNGSCDNLKKNLKEVYQKFGPHKLIVMPRPGMDFPVILTAWGRMEKLSSVDKNKIKAFIDAFRDNGPEQTNEP